MSEVYGYIISDELGSLYAVNKQFKTYVDKYARDHKITVYQAMEHVLVKEYAKYIMGEDEEELHLMTPNEIREHIGMKC